MSIKERKGLGAAWSDARSRKGWNMYQHVSNILGGSHKAFISHSI